ncbi:MAG: hypothetical protein ACHREM_32680 [Polyangiales bacterium]
MFKLPSGATSNVPAHDEDAARVVLARESYKDAPIHEWPCIGYKRSSRLRVHEALLHPV